MTAAPKHDVQKESGEASKHTDNAAVGQKLLDDIQGKLFPDNKPDTVQQLVKDKILPEGSNVIDFGAVKTHLDADQAKMKTLDGKAPADTTAEGKAVTDATGKQTSAQQALDAAQGKIDPIQAKIDERTKLDADVKAAAGTIVKELGKGTIEKEDLTKLAADTTKSPEVQAAAKTLLDTFHDVERTVGGGRGGTHKVKSSESDYFQPHFWSGKPYLDEGSFNDGARKHNHENEADKKALAPLIKERDQLKTGKESADKEVSTAQTALDKVTTQNKDLDEQKTKLAAQIKEEQDVLAPSGDVDKLGRVVKGGGYYQVAENLLGLHGHGHSAMEEKELKMLTHLLQDEAKELHGGKLPKYLVQNDQILKPENLQRVMDKLKASLAPPATNDGDDS